MKKILDAYIIYFIIHILQNPIEILWSNPSQSPALCHSGHVTPGRSVDDYVHTEKL